jgi:hypothetical protein
VSKWESGSEWWTDELERLFIGFRWVVIRTQGDDVQEAYEGWALTQKGALRAMIATAHEVDREWAAKGRAG